MTEPASPTPPPPSVSGWRPPKDAGGNLASAIFGLALVGLGLWYLLDHTLGFDMPRIDWGDAWPIIVIVVGAVILIRSSGRRPA